MAVQLGTTVRNARLDAIETAIADPSVFPDVSDVDAAIIGQLAADSALTALCPDGVFYDNAASGSLRFVIVARLDAADELILRSETGWTQITYLVKAVRLDDGSLDAKAAGHRIHELLEDADLSVAGYTAMMTCHRVQPIRMTEVDEINDARWDHRGGHYDVWVTP